MSAIQRITELPNHNVGRVEKIKMKCNDNDLNVPEPLQSGCFFYIVVGMPGSGKSNLVYSLITKGGPYYKKFEFVVIFSASLKTLDKKLGLPPDQLKTELSEESLAQVLQRIEAEDLRALLIFDDVVASITRGLPWFQKAVWNRRHIGQGISIMLVSQRLNAIPLELRVTATGLFMFRSSNELENDVVRKEFFGLKKEEDFRKVMEAVYKKKYDFLYFNLLGGFDSMLHRNFNKLELHRESDEPPASRVSAVPPQAPAAPGNFWD